MSRHKIKAYLYDNVLTEDPNDFVARVYSERSRYSEVLLFYYAEQVRNDITNFKDAINCVSVTTSQNDMSVYTSCRDRVRPVSATTSANVGGMNHIVIKVPTFVRGMNYIVGKVPTFVRGMNNIVGRVFSFSFETKRKRNKRKVLLTYAIRHRFQRHAGFGSRGLKPFTFRNYSACGSARTVGTQQGIAKTLLFYYAEQVRNDITNFKDALQCVSVTTSKNDMSVYTSCRDASCRDAINCVSTTITQNGMSVDTTSCIDASCRDAINCVSATITQNGMSVDTTSCIDASCKDALQCVSATKSKNNMSVYTSCRDGARPVSTTFPQQQKLII